MQRSLLVPALLALVALPVHGQTTTNTRVIMGARTPSDLVWLVGGRSRLGFGTSSGSSARDTLGVLISSVDAGSAADKAGIEEGNRIAAINGVNLRLAATDVGEPDMGGIMGRRLQRELQKLKTGDDVELKVWQSGKLVTLRVKVQDPAPPAAGRILPPRTNVPRSSIGATIGGTTSPRDTLGVFVAAVVENGPLAKAGVFEGSRIASINGVDLRVPAADVSDPEIGGVRASRLQREVEKLTAGTKVELRVWQNGQYRNVTIDVGSWSELYDNGMFYSEWFTHPQVGAPGGQLLDGLRENRLQGLRENRLQTDGLRNDLRRQIEVRPNGGITGPDGPPRIRVEDRQTPPPNDRDELRALSDSLRAQVDQLRAELERTRSMRPPQLIGASLGAADGPIVVGAAPSAAPAAGAVGSAAPNSDVAFVFPGLRLAAVGTDLAAYLGKGSDAGLLVLEADQSWRGVEQGDVLLSLDGRAVRARNPRPVVLEPGVPHTLELLRAGAKVSVTIDR